MFSWVPWFTPLTLLLAFSALMCVPPTPPAPPDPSGGTGGVVVVGGSSSIGGSSYGGAGGLGGVGGSIVSGGAGGFVGVGGTSAAPVADIDPVELLDAWENRRDHWYMNYYQDANQPLIEVGVTRVFDTRADLLASLGGRHEFRCPSCEGVSSDPYKCTAGTVVKGKACDWKAYGLFGCLGKGSFVFVKEAMHGDTFFTPLAWESGQ